MSIKKTLAAVAAGSLLAGFAAVAVAGPAAAVDQGPVLPGAIYWFNATGNLDTLTAAQQIHSGARTPADATNPKPWLTLALENACPAGSVQVQATIRIPQVGVPENDWEEVAITDQPITKDSQGRFYINAADRMSKPQILQYNIDHPSATGNQFPYLVNCHDATDLALGSFKTTLTVVGTTTADYSWSIPLAAAPVGGFGSGQTQTATTTTLAAAASGANLVLTATVAPAAAGTVTFKEGGVPLGAAVPVVGGVATYTVEAPSNGVHSYSAAFAPTDAVAYGASSAAPQDFTVGAAQNGSITVTLGVPAAPVGAPGSLTFTVPANATVALAGQRDTNNTRVTATGALPTLTVEDTRNDGLLTGWQVNVQASDFTGAAGTVGAKYLGWVPALPSITKDAGAPLNVQAGPVTPSFLDDGTSGGLATSQLLGKSTVSGRGVTKLDAALNLAIPGSTPEGSYTSTVTVTLIGG
jgi:hypothetical protein